MLIEICANSFFSAFEAFKGGANRIELCQNLENGGTTPSAATIRLAVEKFQPGGMAVFVLIRPRSGNFVYNDLEFEVMKKDIQFCKENHVDGVVIGLLNDKNEIDLERTSELIKLAKPMKVTFHRAFDFVQNPLAALEQIIELGAQRLLTSGQQTTALEGMDLIKKLINKAKDRIIVMPGSGINSSNILKLSKQTGAIEFHLSAKKKIYDQNSRESVEGIENEYFMTDREEVERVIQAIKKGD